MNDSQPYQIVEYLNFSNDRKDLLKTHYRRDRKQGCVFDSLIDSYLDQIKDAPFLSVLLPLDSKATIANEPFPENAFLEGLVFRKIRFIMPGLFKLARYGRLIYVVYSAEFLIFPICLYTHLKYPKRPPDKDLKRELTLINTYIEENFK